MSFDGKVVILRDHIRLPIQAGSEVVEVDFIVVDAYSPIHGYCGQTLTSCLKSTLHQKVKYPSGGQIEEIVGNQSTARQCLVAAILHQPEAESSASAEKGL